MGDTVSMNHGKEEMRKILIFIGIIIMFVIFGYIWWIGIRTQ